ncbi:hypothetical protein NE237_000039 [Protea cynaroides]|uniref:Uncharacterized protein n=1 Tax=Protea cynaroides TaxID=273540 RepID=A0A9Q0GMP2_9MAGN|nr:hypothetical protein NE237_000039 [Protea cynaroides]
MDSLPNKKIGDVSRKDVGWEIQKVSNGNDNDDRQKILHKRSLDILHDPWFNKPIRASVWPSTSDSVSDPSDRGADLQAESGGPVSDGPGSVSKGRDGGGGSSSGGSSNQAAVDVLAAGMSGLSFEETGEDENYEYGRGNLMEHACRYCGVRNPACVVGCNFGPYTTECRAL